MFVGQVKPVQRHHNSLVAPDHIENPRIESPYHLSNLARGLTLCLTVSMTELLNLLDSSRVAAKFKLIVDKFCEGRHERYRFEYTAPPIDKLVDEHHLLSCIDRS